MKKLLLIVAMLLAAVALIAQNRIFQNQKITKVSEGGTFEVKCKQGFAVSCYKSYMKGFKTKKINATDYLTEGLGGTVTTTITGNNEFTTVEVVVNGAAFPNLAMNLKNHIDRELLQDTLNYETRRLNDMAARKAALEKDNAFQLKKIENDKADIANRETKIQLNTSAIEKYNQAIIQQEGLVSEIQSKVDDITHLPIK